MAAKFSPHYDMDGQSPSEPDASVHEIRKLLFTNASCDDASPFKPAINSKLRRS